MTIKHNIVIASVYQVLMDHLLEKKLTLPL